MNERCRSAAVGAKSFTELTELIRATDGLSLAQVCSLTGIEQYTVQNWIKRGFVPHPQRKRYFERHVARLLLIDALRDCLQIDRVGELMNYINGNADDTADDVIGEAELYCLFNSAAAGAREPNIRPELVEEKVASVVCEAVDDAPARDRLIPALTVMVNARIAADYKNEADRLYSRIIKDIDIKDS